MSPEPQTPDAATALHAMLGLLAAPAAAVDGAGLVVAANAAGASRLSSSAAEAVIDPAGATRIALDPASGATAMLVWPAAGVVDEAMIELQRADALGRLAGGISHDVANPLGGIQTLSDVLAAEPGIPEDLEASAALLRDESDRVLRLIRSTLDFARRKPIVKNRVSLGPLVRECLELAASATLQLQVRVSVSEVMPELEIDQAKLRQAILGVLLTAIESMGGTWTRSGPSAEGHLRIAGYLAEEDGRYRARLTFEDTGDTVPEETRATLFDGLGGRATRDLAVAAVLVSGVGGRLDYEALADGNRLVLELPLAGDPPLPRRTLPAPRPAAAIAEPKAAAGTPAPNTATVVRAAAPAAVPLGSASTVAAEAGSRPGARIPLTVLVCDDEPSIRGLLARVITREGHEAREASGGGEALAIIDAEPVDLVMADQNMADMTGVDLYRATVDRRPELSTRFVLMSGDAGTPELVEFAAATGLQVIAKPFDLKVIKATMERLSKG